MRIRAGILAIIVLAFVSGGSYAQDPTDAQAAQVAQSLVKRHEAWSSKISTPGASIQAKEFSRENGAVVYRLYVSGLPADKLYTFVEWPVTQPGPVTGMEGVSLGKDGLVSCTGKLPGECNDPDTSPEDHGTIDFTFHPAEGEPFRIALINGDSRASIVIVPNPIAVSNNGCTLDVVRLTPGFELAYFTGSGYAPNTEVSFDSESEGERHTVKTTSNEKGAIRFAIMPFVAGHLDGTTKIAAKGPTCAPSLKFHWGKP